MSEESQNNSKAEVILSTQLKKKSTTANHPPVRLPSSICDAVTKVLKGYDWTLVTTANKQSSASKQKLH
ncbi:hypothetical protein B4U80_09829, partial [Leptotrombidium deliense]